MGRHLKFSAQKILMFFVSVFVLHSATFCLLKAFPGSPLSAEEALDPRVQLNLEQKLGLHKPWYEQYSQHLNYLLDGTLGYSMTSQSKTISQIIADCIPYTLKLAALAWCLATIGSILLSGYFSYYSKSKEYFRWFAVLTTSLPSLFLAPILIWIFAHQLEWFPVALLESWKSWVLPACVLALRPLVSLARILKNSMEQTQSEPFVVAAQSFGFSRSYIFFNVILRNSLVPFFSHLVPLTAGLFSGNVIVETLFGIPGLGSKFVQALQDNDMTLVAGLITFFGMILIASQLLVDLVIKSVDPRQRRFL